MKKFQYRLAKGASYAIITIKKKITGVLGLLLLGLVAFLTVRYGLRQVTVPQNQPIYLSLKPGQTLGHVAQGLQQHYGLKFAKRLVILGYLQGVTQRIQAGDYRFPAQVRLGQLLDDLVQGHVVLHRFTLLEGWTFTQLLQAIAEQSDLKQTLYGDGQRLMAALGFPLRHPEGCFFPDTYSYPAGITDIALLKQAYDRMQEELGAQWQQRAPGLPYDEAYKALIVASMIEKEAKLDRERPLVAAVIVQRLQKRMRLQIDATVLYGLGPYANRLLKRADLRYPTLYNTYVYAGLVPTPIAMPSLSSLSAALHPAKTKALFYVAKKDGSGEHVFSETYQGQRRAIRQYR